MAQVMQTQSGEPCSDAHSLPVLLQAGVVAATLSGGQDISRKSAEADSAAPSPTPRAAPAWHPSCCPGGGGSPAPNPATPSAVIRSQTYDNRSASGAAPRSPR